MAEGYKYNRVQIEQLRSGPAGKKLGTELKEKRSADPNKHFIIRKDEGVCFSERTGCIDDV